MATLRSELFTARWPAAKRRQILVDAGAKLFGIQFAGLLHIPVGKPFRESIGKLFAREQLILIHIESFHKRSREHPARTESAPWTLPPAGASAETRFAGG